LIKTNGNTELKGNLNVGHSDYIYNDALGVNEYITSGEINIGPITLRGYENDSPYSDSEFIFDSKYFSVSSIGDMYGNVKNELKLGQSLEIKDVDNINEASSFGEEYGKTQYITLGSLESYWANHGFDMEIYDKKTTLSDTLKVCTYSSYLENCTTLSFGSILEIKDGEFWETDNAVVKNEFILNGNSNFKKGMSIGAATFCDRIGLAIGDNASVQATGAVSVAIGGKNTSTGKATLANSQYTFAFGRGSQALSWGSIAFGDGNTAGASNAYTSMAFGANCTSTGSNAIACGSNNTAKITGSAVFGIGNKTAELPHELVRQGQFICGTYNDNTTINNAKFVVGRGTSNDNRKNAMIIRANGNAEFGGIIESKIVDFLSDYENMPLISGEIKIGNSIISSSDSDYYKSFSIENYGFNAATEYNAPAGEISSSLKLQGLVDAKYSTWGYGDE
jgi:hypothetical protein